MKNRAMLTILFCLSAAGGWIGALAFHNPMPRVYASTTQHKSELPEAPVKPSTVSLEVRPIIYADTCPAEVSSSNIPRLDTKDAEKNQPAKSEQKPPVVVAAPSPPPPL